MDKTQVFHKLLIEEVFKEREEVFFKIRRIAREGADVTKRGESKTAGQRRKAPESSLISITDFNIFLLAIKFVLIKLVITRCKEIDNEFFRSE